ncbi:unnamed protein product [Prorocentrum cordatum]|uniref:Uncharacterized protein n=1 Tax=Prorocentrum cordatum TaxID=2364126 RepID=A0ABN9UKQ3_9DINO|nr:unnamed protein product [Polarella glacialis]
MPASREFPCAGGSRASSARGASRSIRSGSTTPRSWNGGPAAARGRAAAKRADGGVQALLAEAEGAVREARATNERVLEQRQLAQEQRALEALAITEAAEDDVERLVQEREGLELELAEHLKKVRDLEVGSLVMGDYMVGAQRRANDLERLLRRGHPTRMRHDWSPVEIEEQDDSFDAGGEAGLDVGSGACSPRSAAAPRPPGSAAGRPRRPPAPSVGGSTARRASALQGSFQDIQDELRAVKDHPRRIAEDTEDLEEQLQQAYRERRRLETAVADRRHAAAITETLAHLRREAAGRAAAPAAAGQPPAA